VPDTPATQLHYAPPLPLAHQRRVQRAILWVALAVLLAIAGVVALPLLRYLRVLHLQSRCLDYRPTAAAPIFDTRAATLPTLQRSDRNYVNGRMGGMPFVAYVPRVWRDFASVAVPGSRALAIPFLHRLRSPGGAERLVAIEVVPMDTNPPGIVLSARVLVPGSSGEPPRECAVSTSLGFAVSAQYGELTIYPGALDPTKSDHFTINVVANGRSEPVDGWLLDNGSLVLEQPAQTAAGTAEGNTPTPPSRPSPASPR
jgi:hypothetical protein